AEPQTSDRGPRAVELRPRADAGGRPWDARGPRVEDSGGRDAQQATGVGSGEGGQAPREDHVPAGALHLPGGAGRDPRAGGVDDDEGLPLDLDAFATGLPAQGSPFRSVVVACVSAVGVVVGISLYASSGRLTFAAAALWCVELV